MTKISSSSPHLPQLPNPQHPPQSPNPLQPPNAPCDGAVTGGAVTGGAVTGAGTHGALFSLGVSTLAFSGGATISPFLLYQALADVAVNDTKSKTTSKMQSVFLALSNDCFLIHPHSELIFSLIQFQTNIF
jgi:hypothetical protein